MWNYVSISNLEIDDLHSILLFRPPQEIKKSDSIIVHFSKRKNGNLDVKLCYCLIDQSGIRRDWVNLARTSMSDILGRDLGERLA